MKKINYAYKVLSGKEKESSTSVDEDDGYDDLSSPDVLKHQLMGGPKLSDKFRKIIEEAARDFKSPAIYNNLTNVLGEIMDGIDIASLLLGDSSSNKCDICGITCLS